MNNEELNNENNKNIINNFKDKVKNINLEIQVDFSQDENEKKVKLPYIFPKKVQSRDRKKIRKKLVQIGNFCQSIYTHSNVSMNDTKTMEDILYDTKLKAIEDIKNDFFINQRQEKQEKQEYKEENNYIDDNKKIYRKIILNRSKPKSLRKIDISLNDNNDNREEKFTYLTTTYERKPKQENKKKANNSIDNNKSGRNIYNYGDYASNKLIINHPKLYILNNKRENGYNKLPVINRGHKRLHVIKEFSKLVPDNFMLSREEKLNKYDEYMRMKELKELKNV